MESPLPVELIHFIASCEDAGYGKSVAKLIWSTASETNNKGYHIQKSTDGRTRKNVAWVEGAGTIREQKNYTYTDLEGTNGYPAGIAYYRLGQEDQDGRINYSKTIVLENCGVDDRHTIHIFPNPGSASDIIFILPGDAQSEHIVQIIHTDGRLILQTKLSGGEHHLAELCGHLQPGIYHIITINAAQNNDLFIHQKFIVLP